VRLLTAELVAPSSVPVHSEADPVSIAWLAGSSTGE
jgi:hypothetical protein